MPTARPSWLHRRSQTCLACEVQAFAVEQAGWLLPDGVPDLGYCVTHVPHLPRFGTSALCSVPSAHVMVVSAWPAGMPDARWAACLDVCSAHNLPHRWDWVDWRWLFIDGASLHLAATAR